MYTGPPAHPCSDTGRLQSDINRIDSELRRKADSHEITTLSSNVADLARSIRDVGSVCDGFLRQLEILKEVQDGFRERIAELDD